MVVEGLEDETRAGAGVVVVVEEPEAESLDEEVDADEAMKLDEEDVGEAPRSHRRRQCLGE
jgi:hypothetical protein